VIPVAINIKLRPWRDAHNFCTEALSVELWADVGRLAVEISRQTFQTPLVSWISANTDIDITTQYAEWCVLNMVWITRGGCLLTRLPDHDWGL